MATPVETNTQKCSVGSVQAAIFDQRPLIEYEVNEKLENRPRYMIKKIKDGGAVDPHDDGRTLIMGKGYQAPVGYHDYNDPYAADCDPVLEEGYQEAQGNCGATSVKMGALINKTEQDQCNGVCVVDFAQGYRYRGSDDYNLKLATPERCIEELAKKERRFVMQYLEQEAESFSETAFQSFDHHLVNLAIERGGANAVVKSALNGTLPILTEGGWDIGNDPANEVKHVTFWFFDQYRRQIVQRLRQFGKGENAENYIAEFEVTREAYRQMMIAETLTRTGEGGYIPGLGEQVRIDEKVFKKAHQMSGRRFAMSPDGMCRFIFVEDPIRGFLQPTGTTPAGKNTYDFIRVYHLKNVADEESGVRAVYNPEYDYNCVSCGGVEYPLMELIPHIHEESFVRHGLTKGIGPKGVTGAGTNFEMSLLQGDALSSKDCPNFFQNKYRYAARHHMRWRDVYPELSGFILHRRRILGGYDIDANDDCYKIKDGQACATPEEINNCNEERCDNGCPPGECDPANNTTSLQPCGAVNTSWCGEQFVLTLKVCRSAECATEAASVNYLIAPGTALEGTHYTPLGPDGNPGPAAGIVEWEAGESGCKEICIRIDGALPDTPAEDPEGPCCEETSDTSNPACFSVKLDGPKGTVLEECSEVEICINNRTGEVEEEKTKETEEG